MTSTRRRLPRLFNRRRRRLAYVSLDQLSASWAFSEASGQRWNAYQDAANAADTGTVPSSAGRADFVAANSDYLEVANVPAVSLGANTPFTWTIKFNTDIINTGFLFAKGDSAADNERYSYACFLSAGGNISFRLGNGTIFTTVATTGAGITTGTDHQVICAYDAANQQISIKLDNGPLFTAAWTGGTYAGTFKLAFGRAGEFSGAYYDGRLWDAAFWLGRFLTTAEQTTLIGQAYPFGVASYQITTLDPNLLSNQHSRHDFSNVATLWQDTGKTTPVAADADPIRVAASLWGMHDWTAPADNVRPIYKANIANNLSIGRWTGSDPEAATDSELDFDAPFPPAGDFTLFLVVKNSDDAAGSHIFAGGAHYLFVTGASYDATSPRAGAHTIDNNAVVSSGKYLAANTYMVLELTRSGATYSFALNGQNIGTLVNASGMAFTKIGLHTWNLGAAFDNWHFSGDFCEHLCVQTVLGAMDAARIRYFLAQKWGIANVHYQPYLPT